MWQEARTIVKTLFQDTIELYKRTAEINTIGEIETRDILCSTHNCNIQMAPSLETNSELGTAHTQTLRNSLAKDVGLDPDTLYSLKIKHARIKHTQELWDIISWEEGQLSTVLTAQRRVFI